MGTYELLQLVLIGVKAGFALSDIVSKVGEMRNRGVSEKEIHDYLKSLAHKAQDDLEKA